ncbi:hypothetical protein BY996DRAFT_6595263 [Phakopsora pachyrhizi]|nr:hypothetical protein BY996DRAFT_6595263 [Phakopsora pachyrhizi]
MIDEGELITPPVNRTTRALLVGIAEAGMNTIKDMVHHFHIQGAVETALISGRDFQGLQRLDFENQREGFQNLHTPCLHIGMKTAWSIKRNMRPPTSSSRSYLKNFKPLTANTAETSEHIKISLNCTTTEENSVFMLDTGANNLVSGPSPYLYDLKTLSDPYTVKLALASLKLLITAQVYYCADIKGSLISIGAFVKDGWQNELINQNMKITNNKGKVFRLTFKNNFLYIHPVITLHTVTAKNLQSSYSWLCCLSHSSNDQLKALLKQFVPDFDIKSWQPFFCEHCAKSKGAFCRTNVASSLIPSKEILGLVILDVMGPIKKPGCQRHYLLNLQDHVSAYTLATPLKSRAKVKSILEYWFQSFSNSHGK